MRATKDIALLFSAYTFVGDGAPEPNIRQDFFTVSVAKYFSLAMLRSWACSLGSTSISLQNPFFTYY